MRGGLKQEDGRVSAGSAMALQPCPEGTVGARAISQPATQSILMLGEQGKGFDAGSRPAHRIAEARAAEDGRGAMDLMRMVRAGASAERRMARGDSEREGG